MRLEQLLTCVQVDPQRLLAPVALEPATSVALETLVFEVVALALRRQLALQFDTVERLRCRYDRIFQLRLRQILVVEHEHVGSLGGHFTRLALAPRLLLVRPFVLFRHAALLLELEVTGVLADLALVTGTDGRLILRLFALLLHVIFLLFFDSMLRLLGTSQHVHARRAGLILDPAAFVQLAVLEGQF